MIYEVRTYGIVPGKVPEFERLLAEAMPYREKWSPLAACWRVEFGDLNQVIHVWPYNDLEERKRIRRESALDPRWPPKTGPIETDTNSEIFNPAPFMRPIKPAKLGNVYEMRTYTYKVGHMPEIMERWAEAVPHREKYSPLAACWYTEFGALNRVVHIWPYKDLAEREKIRAAAAKDPHWPPRTQEWLVKAESKLLIPSYFSPLH
jgi:hypothetical protein